LFLFFAACQMEDEAADPNVIEVMATHNPETGEHLFDLSSAETGYGWTTFRFVNASPDVHFAVLAKLPDDEGQYDSPVTFQEWLTNVTNPFQEGMNNIIDPEIEGDAVFAPFADLPDWFEDVEHSGGPGFTAPGRTVETTVYLEPGTYVMECYVKNEKEEFHSYLGMIEEITVTDEPSNAPEPEADFEMTLSSTNGIEIDDRITPGTHTIAVHFEDQKIYEHMIGHDVHLVQLEGTEVTEVARWLNWMIPGELVSPSPGTFLGGTQTSAAGRTAYFTVDLEPGHYAWISEVPANNEMWKTFEVSQEDGAGY
ncbi:MAG: hypothetical protein WD552_01330, partial [Candidatus Paceibacterota bacterium]